MDQSLKSFEALKFKELDPPLGRKAELGIGGIPESSRKLKKKKEKKAHK
jgi:hypothetical protein